MTTQIQDFIISTVLITTIDKIINGLENGIYRDCDIKWLDSKMNAFIEFAAKTLGVVVNMPERDLKASFATLNSYVLNYYHSRFNTLLNYFKSL